MGLSIRSRSGCWSAASPSPRRRRVSSRAVRPSNCPPCRSVASDDSIVAAAEPTGGVSADPVSARTVTRAPLRPSSLSSPTREGHRRCLARDARSVNSNVTVNGREGSEEDQPRPRGGDRRCRSRLGGCRALRLPRFNDHGTVRDHDDDRHDVERCVRVVRPALHRRNGPSPSDGGRHGQGRHRTRHTSRASHDGPSHRHGPGRGDHPDEELAQGVVRQRRHAGQHVGSDAGDGPGSRGAARPTSTRRSSSR